MLIDRAKRDRRFESYWHHLTSPIGLVFLLLRRKQQETSSDLAALGHLPQRGRLNGARSFEAFPLGEGVAAPRR